MNCTEPPPPSAHQHSNAENGRSYVHNDVVEYVCNQNYYPTSDNPQSSKVCGDDGIWRPAGDTLECTSMTL